MFTKTGRMIFDLQKKRKLSANKKLLMIDRKKKKQKTEHLSEVDDQVGSSEKATVQNVDNGVDGVLVRESKRKLSSIIRKVIRCRKKLSIIRKVIRCRKKRKMEKVDKMDEVVEPIDEISDMPDLIIHNILSFLRCPKDVARITVLSKKWRSIWASFISFDFDQKKFKASGGYHIDKFITYVDNTLATKLESMHMIHKFKLSLCETSKKLNLRVNDWLSAAINKHVRELEIHVEEKRKTHYVVPDAAFTAKKLTSLKLYGCKFHSAIVFDLGNLKELSIKNSHITGDVMHSFILGCPLVEDLRLVHCAGIGHLNISNLDKLRTLEIHECHGLRFVNVNLPNLVSFLHWGKEKWECDITLNGCENLKNLTLKSPGLTDELFHDTMTKFPNLEKIALRECNRLGRITILSSKIKELSVIKCKKIEDAVIDAPNLSTLEYVGEKMPFSLMNVASLHEANLHLQIRKNKSIVTKELLIFIQKFAINGGWKLILKSNKNITIHEELTEIPLLSYDDIKLQLIKSPMKVKAYIDHLLRMSRPKSLSLMSSSSSDLLKFMKEKIMSREHNPNCCTYYSKKCWLHHIEDVKMAGFKGGAEIGEASRIVEETTFIFNWKSKKLHNAEITPDNTILLGPWGGNGGNSWDDGVHTGVRDITLVYGSCIDSIRVTYDKYGKPFPAEKHGGVGGTKTAQIKLQFPEEVLISVSGHYGPVVYGGGPVIRSLTFKSNRRTYGPFGVEEGTPFNFMTNGGHIVGFYGRGGWFIDSLGFVLAPKISLFHRIHMMFRGFHPFAIKDDEHQKNKGSKGYSWGI
ncbi:F-box/FBD/LRR-repeat protein isoform X1 [Tanacetum coccineum]